MSVVESFRQHVTSVEKLMNFDRDVLEFAVSSLRELKTKLTRHHKLDNPELTAERTLQILEGIREHDSLRPRYQTIFNQALVLLVSYFGSSVHDMFRRGITEALAHDSDSQLLREQVHLSLRDLRDANFELRDLAPDLLVQAKDISFQDMQSIARVFRDYLDVNIDKSEVVNDIILGQACRHVIVHSGGMVDERLIRQISGAKPRRVKFSLIPGERVQFSDQEVMLVSDSMVQYLQSVAGKVAGRYGVEV